MTNERQLLDAVEREFTQVGYRWVIFCQLFDSGQENVDLLNRSGSNVFQLLQQLILDDVMLGLCRLTDPPKSMGSENASLRNLVEKLQARLPTQSKLKIDTKLTELNAHLSKVRELRNKALSHNDLSHAISATLLPRPTYDELEGAIDSATSILNEITGRVFDYSTEYMPHVPYGYDGNKLLKVLGHAHRVSE